MPVLSIDLLLNSSWLVLLADDIKNTGEAARNTVTTSGQSVCLAGLVSMAAYPFVSVAAITIAGFTLKLCPSAFLSNPLSDGYIPHLWPPSHQHTAVYLEWLHVTNYM